MLLPYQKCNIEKLNSVAKEHTNLTIVGKEHSGRKYVIEEWSKGIEHSLIIRLEKTGLNCEYAALVSTLKRICRVERHRIVISPTVGLTLSVYTLGISLSINDDSILKSEKIIKKCLKKLLNKYNLIFIIDLSLNITDESLELLEDFCTNYKGKNICYRFNLTTERISNNTCIYFDSMSTYKSDKIEILKSLNLNPKINLDNNVINFIFSNISDNVELLINIISNINNENLDYTLADYDADNLIKTLLEESLKDYKYSSLLTYLLRMYTIKNYYFKTIDLMFLLNQTEKTIKILQEFALHHFLIEGSPSNYQIIFGLVKKIYANADPISRQNMYMNIVSMFSTIYPSDYYNKYVFANLAQNSECNIYLMQYLFQEIRLNHNINISDYSDTLNDKESLIVETYNCALGLLNEKKYDKCITSLDALTELDGALLYEINILKSQCLIRKIDRSGRERALRGLSYNNTNTALDENLKFRIDIRKIASYIHVGKYDDALNICAQVKERLIQMHRKTNAIEYEYYLNVIYRKYTYVSEYDLSVNELEKSVDFFRRYQRNYFKAFYIALNNLFSLYIIIMNLEKAKNTKDEIEKLKIYKNGVNFPRIEILKNNSILFEHFSQIITPKEGMIAFEKLYYETEGLADHIFIASNYAVFMMLNDNLLKANAILNQEFEKTREDQEGIYNYRIAINLSICEFLIDNSKKAESLERLNNINYNREDPHYRVRNEELSSIINLMNTITECNSANEWCAKYKSLIHSALNIYTTYQQGLIFTTLFDWDDD